jgi:hypothetical protein
LGAEALEQHADHPGPVQPAVRNLPDDTDPVQYVLDANLHRRHLRESQRGMVAAKLADLDHGSNRFQHKVEGQPCPSTTIDGAAEALNTSTGTLKRAKTVIEKGEPEVVAAVESGEVNVSAGVTAQAV